MEEQERREWAFRESEIAALQHERMVLLKQKLQQREGKYQELNERRLEHLWSAVNEGREKMDEQDGCGQCDNPMGFISLQEQEAESKGKTSTKA